MFYIDLEKFLVSEDTTDIEWKEVKIQNKDLIRRWGHASSVKGDKAYIFGGRYSNKDLQNFVEVDLITEKCSAIKLESSVKGRRKPGLCFKNNTMFLFSGFDGSYLKDFLFVDLTQIYSTILRFSTKKYFQRKNVHSKTKCTVFLIKWNFYKFLRIEEK